MNDFNLLIFNVIIIVLFSCNGQAQEIPNGKSQITVRIAALKISKAINENKDGVFDLMIEDIEKLSGVAHQYIIVPTARGAEMFFKHKVDCLIPAAFYMPYYKGYNVIFSEVYVEATYHIFTHKDDVIITNKNQLKNKTIGVIRDRSSWDFQKRYDIQGSTFVKVNDSNALASMLNKKHIDAVIGSKGFIRLNKKLGYPTPNYSPEYPLAVDKLTIVCHKSEANNRYIQAINPHIKEIVNSGKMKIYQNKSFSH